MVLDKLKNSLAYERLLYLESQTLYELEPLFFSITYPVMEMRSRLPWGISHDAEIEGYINLGVMGLLLLGGAGAMAYNLFRRDKKKPLDIASHITDSAVITLETTVSLAGSAVNGAGRVFNTAANSARESVKSLSSRVKQ